MVTQAQLRRRGRNYKAVVDSLLNLEAFEHTTMSALWEADAISGEPTYNVYSYRTLVAQFRPGAGYWVTTERYSVTTSKQCGKIRYAFSMREKSSLNP